MTEEQLLARRMSADYNCCHFVCEAWLAETGHDTLTPVLAGMLAREPAATPAIRHAMARLPAPLSPCVVLLRRREQDSHVGLYVRGLVFHLTRTGPIRQPLHIAAIGARTIRFYAVR